MFLVPFIVMYNNRLRSDLYMAKFSKYTICSKVAKLVFSITGFIESNTETTVYSICPY